MRLFPIFFTSICILVFVFTFLKFGQIDFYLLKINFKIFFLVFTQENISAYEKIILYQFFRYVLIPPLLVVLFFIFLKLKKKEIYSIVSKYVLIFNVCFLFVITFITVDFKGVNIFYDKKDNKTDFFAKNFFQENLDSFQPDHNLILIILESFDEKVISRINSSYKFSKIKKLNNFNKYKINNFYSFPGSNFTVGSMIATFCGVPFKLPDFPYKKFWELKDYTLYAEILKNHKCINDLLKERKYNTEFLANYEINFQGFDNFLRLHPFDKIYSNNFLKKKYKSNPDGYFKSISDADLFDFAFERVKTNVDKKNNFFIVVSNVDTHAPGNLFSREKCKDFLEYEKKDISYLCTISNLNKFIYKLDALNLENTSLILISDHLISYEIDKNKLFNLILTNKEIIINDSIYGHYDMFPLMMTILNKKKYNKYYLGNFPKEIKEYENLISDFYKIINNKSKKYESLW
jgi:hypothetical protein